MSVYNVYPQENIYLPLADEVNGLRDYFLSFYRRRERYRCFEPFDFRISMNRKSSDHVYYEITWDKQGEDKDALYTLVCYDTDGKLYLPVRTVKGNEEAIARVGAATRRNLQHCIILRECS